MNMLAVTPKGQEVKMDSGGRIMIPVNIRRNMKLEPGKVFEVLTSNEKILIYRLVR
jgi:AbrB family looped-hinge helix DNA binding protein